MFPNYQYQQVSPTKKCRLSQPIAYKTSHQHNIDSMKNNKKRDTNQNKKQRNTQKQLNNIEQYSDKNKLSLGIMVSQMNILKLYQRQHQNLISQNIFLNKQIHKILKHQQFLHQYLLSLKKQIQVLQSSQQQHPTSAINPHIHQTKLSHYNHIYQNLDTIQYCLPLDQSVSKFGNKIFQQGQTKNTISQIDQLNQKFNMLMSQYSTQPNHKTKSIFKLKLAQTVQRIKILKKQKQSY